MASIAAILLDYPAETIRYVTDPRTGIASNPLADPETGRVWNGMPDPANVKRACELHHAPTRRMIEREAAARKQIAEREQLAIGHQRPRKTYAEIVEECRAMGIMIGHKGTEAVDVGAIRTKHGISQEQWDAIPNAK